LSLPRDNSRNAAGGGMTLNRGEAIAAHCYWCVGKHGVEARKLTDACPITWCALWDYRPHLRPGDLSANSDAPRRHDEGKV
jgi:hypothetical protein